MGCEANEITEMWREIKQERQEKRQSNLEFSRKLLTKEGIKFEEKPNGHFIVGDYDFWATTGLYIHRETKKRGRGVFNLIKKIKNKK